MLLKYKLFFFCLGFISIAPASAEEVRLSDEVTPDLIEKSPFTSNINLTSNYLLRGISLTGGKPAIQGGSDYERRGFYAGVWGSSISILSDTYQETNGSAGAINGSLELDTYIGFKEVLKNSFSYDAGFLRYNYPGRYGHGSTSANTNEVYGALGYKWITAKYSYSLGNTFGYANTTGTNYVELNAVYPVKSLGIALGAHYGKQTFVGSGATDINGNSLTYSDYRLNVTKEMDEKFEFSLAYSNTNATPAYTVLKQNLGKAAVVGTLTRVF
jgi:uncharacterized protein (TIGR02001 family)